MAWQLLGKKTKQAAPERGAVPLENASVQALRRRLKQRLLGSALLVLLGVLVFSLLLDSQPRPFGAGKVADLIVDIPDKSKTAPLEPPAPVVARPPAESASAAFHSNPVASAAFASRDASPAVPVASQAVTTHPDARDSRDSHDSAKDKEAEGQKVQALLDDKTSKPTADQEPKESSGKGTSVDEKADRYAVQAGAFADAAKAKEVRLKLEKAGLKTYTQVVQTKEGRRIRVRLGPFATEAEAEKTAKRIKTLDLSAVVLKL